MTEPTVTRVNAATLAEALPWLVGYEPADAILVVLTREHGQIHQTGVMQLAGYPATLAGVQRMARGSLNDGVQACLLYAWVSAPDTTCPQLADLADELRQIGLRIDGTYTVDPERITGHDPDGAYHEARRDPRKADPIAVQLIARGHTTATSREALARTYQADADAAMATAPDTLTANECLDAWLDCVLTGRIEQPTPEQLGILAAIGRWPTARDAMLTVLSPTLHKRLTDDDPNHTTTVPELTQEARAAATARLAALARRMPDTTGVPDVLAILAFEALYEQGSGPIAAITSSRALSIDPDHVLSQAIDAMMYLGKRV